MKESPTTWLCDDCLSDRTKITPRQQINIVARQLAVENLISRVKQNCHSCKKLKILNRINLPSKVSNKDLALVADGQIELPPLLPYKSNIKEGCYNNKPWFWEGNIQSTLVKYLEEKEYKIKSTADTSSRESGKDIVAMTPDNKLLWVSVKGWPEKSINTQARHWFSQALFDIILYMDEDIGCNKAIAFPDKFKTYSNLRQRITWFKSQAGFKIYWVNENGKVSVD